jgi:hypothetical protein
MRIALLAAILFSHVFVRAQDETPFILDVSQVVAGRIEPKLFMPTLLASGQTLVSR